MVMLMGEAEDQTLSEEELASYVLCLQKWGLQDVANLVCTSLVPLAPLMEHVGIFIYGRELSDMPRFWRLIGSSQALNALNLALNGENDL
jgi:hypothetical protein